VLLKGLAQDSKGLCLVTTRYRIKNIEAYTAAAPERDLAPLSKQDGVRLLERLGVKGTRQEREQLANDVRGHALTLNLIGSYLKKFFLGDIRKRDRFAPEKANRKFRDGYTSTLWARTSGSSKAKKPRAVLARWRCFNPWAFSIARRR
jgi:hypothetical protein